jgi:pyrrolidone-carboxylate peptidase
VQKIGRYVIVTLLLIVLTAAVAWSVGRSAGRRELMIEAVKENHGHYRIVDNVGSTVFEWGSALK